MATAGLFLSHVRSERIERHFERLVRESGDAIAWHFVLNAGNQPAPRIEGLACPAPESTMPLRHAAMRRNGMVSGGFMDTAIWPCLVALDAEFTWVFEYDVDYSGCWSRFFAPFAGNRADLLTTTLLPRPLSPEWYWWRSASAPSGIPESGMYRAFLPAMRVSRAMTVAYARRMGMPGWAGHYEFTIPTAAMAEGLGVEDIGGGGPLCPPDRVGRHYTNTPNDAQLIPGTFVWRPARPHYFHEAPAAFAEPDKLYHPVKPDVSGWEQAYLAKQEESRRKKG